MRNFKREVPGNEGMPPTASSAGGNPPQPGPAPVADPETTQPSSTQQKLPRSSSSIIREVREGLKRSDQEFALKQQARERRGAEIAPEWQEVEQVKQRPAKVAFAADEETLNPAEMTKPKVDIKGKGKAVRFQSRSPSPRRQNPPTPTSDNDARPEFVYRDFAQENLDHEMRGFKMIKAMDPHQTAQAGTAVASSSRDPPAGLFGEFSHWHGTSNEFSRGYGRMPSGSGRYSGHGSFDSSGEDGPIILSPRQGRDRRRGGSGGSKENNSRPVSKTRGNLQQRQQPTMNLQELILTDSEYHSGNDNDFVHYRRWARERYQNILDGRGLGDPDDKDWLRRFEKDCREGKFDDMQPTSSVHSQIPPEKNDEKLWGRRSSGGARRHSPSPRPPPRGEKEPPSSATGQHLNITITLPKNTTSPTSPTSRPKNHASPASRTSRTRRTKIPPLLTEKEKTDFSDSSRFAVWARDRDSALRAGVTRVPYSPPPYKEWVAPFEQQFRIPEEEFKKWWDAEYQKELQRRLMEGDEEKKKKKKDKLGGFKKSNDGRRRSSRRPPPPPPPRKEGYSSSSSSSSSDVIFTPLPIPPPSEPPGSPRKDEIKRGETAAPQSPPKDKDRPRRRESVHGSSGSSTDGDNVTPPRTDNTDTRPGKKNHRRRRGRGGRRQQPQVDDETVLGPPLPPRMATRGNCRKKQQEWWDEMVAEEQAKGKARRTA